MSPIYIILVALAVLLLSFRSDKNKTYQIVGALFLFLIYIVGALRDSSIGTDIELNDDGYHLLWKAPFDYYRDIEKGFMYITYIIKNLIPSYYAYYSIIYIITIYFFCSSAKNLGINKYSFVAIIFLAGYLHVSFNIIRQIFGLSFALYVYSIYYVKTFKNQVGRVKTEYVRNTILFELLILLSAYTLHNSIILLSIIPLFDNKVVCRFLDNDIILLALLGVTIVVTVLGHDYIVMALTLFEGFFGERADMYINNYLVFSESAESAHGYITSLVNGIIAIFISSGRRNKFFYIGFFGILLTEIASFGMGTIGRAFWNLQYFINLYYSQVWYKPLPKKAKLNGIKTVFLKVLRIVFWLSSLHYTLLINESVNPYKTFIFR